ncbi:Flp family type IVb pilin [Stakelama sp. CBK3Z-3]|uniref:Flp family type IVb pilin n=1 Tax=Stakelama flava TaxID=2860338 RepID=A0ABS6XJH7_9SPHN|nr:Flp family type IVb pilin [Stakelama flava]MBW4329610.1 Flp family type IVb pilin [Stakelama flava]
MIEAILHATQALVRNRAGATAVEYGLIVALIVIVIIGAISSLGGGTGGLWGTVHDKVVDAMG